MIIDNIEKVMRGMWEYTHDFKQPLKPKFKVLCHFCDIEMMFQRYSIHERDYKNPKAHKYRIDISFKCPSCGHIESFGVAISEEYYNEVKDMILKKTGKNITIIHAAEEY